MHNYFFFGTCISMFFFSFFSPWIPGSLGRIVIFVFFHLLYPVIVLAGLKTYAPANRRPPPKGKKKKKSCCQPEPTISAIYLKMATVDGKDLPHDPLSHGRQGMSSLFFLLFFFCRTALGIVLFCFCCHYRPVMASWCGASSILFMTPGLRLSSVF